MTTVAMTNRPTGIRRAILLDAAASGTMGVLLLLGAGVLAQPLGLPTGLLRWTGVVLIPFATTLIWIARRPSVSQGSVQAIVAVNVLWAVGTPLLLATSWVNPTVLGELFVLIQAAVVAGFAYLENRAFR